MKRILAAILSIALPSSSAAAVDKKACIESHEQAQKLRKEGKLQAAHDKLLVCAAESCPSLVRGDCAQWVGEVEKDLPSVVVKAHDENGADILGDATLEIDGKQAPLDGKTIVLDPGVHAIKVTRASGAVLEEQVLVRVGEHNRVVDLNFPAATKSAGESGSGVPAYVPYVLGGVGVVALGSFAYFGLHARSRVNDLRDECAPRCDPADRPSIKRELLAADISLGVAVVSLGLGAYFYFSSPATSAPKSAVGFSPLAGGGLASFRAEF
jgi:hypothetical protein